MDIKHYERSVNVGRKREMGSLALSVTQASYGCGPGHRMWLFRSEREDSLCYLGLFLEQTLGTWLWGGEES